MGEVHLAHPACFFRVLYQEMPSQRYLSLINILITTHTYPSSIKLG